MMVVIIIWWKWKWAVMIMIMIISNEEMIWKQTKWENGEYWW